MNISLYSMSTSGGRTKNGSSCRWECLFTSRTYDALVCYEDTARVFCVISGTLKVHAFTLHVRCITLKCNREATPPVKSAGVSVGRKNAYRNAFLSRVNSSLSNAISKGPAALIIVLSLAVILILLGALERFFHERALKSIPVLIHVNGTRGKSSTTRLMAGALLAAGYRVIAKTTGTTPRLILEDGEELPIKRKGAVTVLEQLRVVRFAARRRAEVLVTECMGVNPEVQWALEHRIVKSTIGVITNVRTDHLDEMGPTLEDIARCLALTVPRNGLLVTAEERFFPLFQTVACQRGTQVLFADPASVTADEMARFSRRVHRDNLACALKVCSLLGVERETALQGMERATPDPGSFKIWKVTQDEQDVFFINVLSANDLTSTQEAWNDPQSQKLISSCFTVVLFNNRSDRSFRISEMARFIQEQDGIDHILISGEQKLLAKRRFQKEGMGASSISLCHSRLQVEEVLAEMVRLAPGKQVAIFACGNIKGDGWAFVDFFERNGEEL